ncbi:MAG: hypothetical protein ABH886_03990 [Candidatus Desantisbacteria bacterium]
MYLKAKTPEDTLFFDTIVFDNPTVNINKRIGVVGKNHSLGSVTK